MLLPNVLRKIFARLFSRLTLGGFPVLDPLRQPCPVTPRFRPVLEMLELRMMPTVTATYTAASGLFIVNANGASTATAMTVTASTNNQVVLTLTGKDSFTTGGDAALGSSGDFVLSNSNATLTINTGAAPLVHFDITQRSNNEPLTFGLAATTSGVSNISITGTGDAVTFTGINNLSGNLTDTSGSVTVSTAITVGGSVSLTGLAVGSGTTNNSGVVLGSSVTAGVSGNITITGSGSVSGTGHNYGVYATGNGALSAGGSVTITGMGQGTGVSNMGVNLFGLVRAGSRGSITLTGIGSSSGSGTGIGVDFESLNIDDGQGVLSAGGSVTITGTGQGTGSDNVGVEILADVQAGPSGNVTLRGNVSSGGYVGNDGVFIGAGVSAGGSIAMTGTGTGTGGGNVGVDFYNGGSSGSVVAVHGALTISGSSGGSGVSGSSGANSGVVFKGASPVEVTGTGALTITGTSGTGTGSNNFGVEILKSGTAVLGSSGGIRITGTARGSGANAYGVGVASDTQIQAFGTGNVTLTGQAPASMPAIDFASDGSGVTVATGSVILTGNQIDLGDPDSISSTSTSGSAQLGFRSYTHGYGIVLGGGSDVPNKLTFTSTDAAAIAQGGSNNGFGRITIGYANGGNPVSLGGMISFGTTVSLEAQGGMTLQVPNAADYNTPDLSVTGQLYLNNDPLHLIAPTAAAVHGAHITMIHTTKGTVGTIFLNLPQGAVATDTLGHKYTIGYSGNGTGDVVLNAL